jgi:hypothetical protein
MARFFRYSVTLLLVTLGQHLEGSTFVLISSMIFFVLLSPDLSIAMTTDVYEWAHSMQKMMIRVCLFFPMPTWARVSVSLLLELCQDLL